MKKTGFLITALVAQFCGAAAWAQAEPEVDVAVEAAVEAEIVGDARAKFRVEGDRLIYDTENVPEGVRDDIEGDDADILRDILTAHPGITVLELNSGGGSLWASRKMSDIVIDYGLNTHVNGDCNSSCTRVFLAGTDRSMSRGSRMGFHRNSWTASGIESYFTSQAEQEGWDNPYEFASWMYDDTQREVHEALIYMVDRGVNPLFAVQTMQAPAASMWFPYRIKLRAAGVLTQ